MIPLNEQLKIIEQRGSDCCMKPQLNIDLHDAIDKAGSGNVVLTRPEKTSNYETIAVFSFTKSVSAKTAR